MQLIESFTSEAMFPNQRTGREFLVKYFTGQGYRYPCRSCKGTATFRLEIYSHIFEPQGSEYYCAACVPPPPTKAGE